MAIPYEKMSNYEKNLLSDANQNVAPGGDVCRKCCAPLDARMVDHHQFGHQKKEVATNKPFDEAFAMFVTKVFFHLNIPLMMRFVFWVLVVTYFFVLTTSMIMYNHEMNQVGCEGKTIPPNVLPCISATISVEPQRYFWRYITAIVAGPMFLTMVAKYRFFLYRTTFVSARWLRWYKLLVTLQVVTHFGEWMGFLTTSLVMNREIFVWHATGTTAWLTFACIHTPITVLVMWMSRPPKEEILTNYPNEYKSFKVKAWCALVTCVFALGLTLAFNIHMALCAPYAHSAFSFFEYFIILCSCFFHYTECWDFHDSHVVVGPPVPIAHDGYIVGKDGPRVKII